jgi:hypothetical protein
LIVYYIEYLDSCQYYWADVISRLN